MKDPIDARLWPYVAPYGVLLSLAELGRWLPALEVPLIAARVAFPAALLLIARRSGAYAELSRAIGSGRWRDVAFGLGIAALWLAPYLLWPELSHGEPLFDPDRLGPDRRTAWLALRLCGFVLVSPLVEELFVRSFLHRVVEAWPSWADFATRPVGRAHVLAFAITSAWFMLSHVPWEWWVAAPTGVLLNLWLYQRGSLRSVCLAHAIANAVIGAVVLFGPWELWALL